MWMPEFPFQKENTGHMTRDEVMACAYKPAPAAHTVDSEEDFHKNVLIQREYYSPQAKANLSADFVPLAGSESEKRALMHRFAEEKLAEEKSAARSHDANAKVEKDISFSPSDVEEQLGAVSGVAYQMDGHRREIIEKLSREIPTLDALVEAVALAEGCETYDGKQGWLATFFGLHDKGLEQLGERVSNLQGDAEALRDDEAMTMSEAEAREGPLPNEYVEYAPVYKAYLKYCRGESKTPYCTIGDLGETGLLAAYAERVRWRKLFDKIGEAVLAARLKVPERRDGVYLDHLKPKIQIGLSEREREDAFKLNHQLQTLRLFDAKKVEIQRELVTRVNLGAGGSPQHEAFGVKHRNMPEDLRQHT